MAHRQYRGVVDRVETVRSSPGKGYYTYELLVLRDVARLDGTPTASEQRVAMTGTMRRLGVEPGNVITFSAQVDAYSADGRRIASDIGERESFLAVGGAEGADGVTYRLAQPLRIAVVAYRG